MCHGAIWRNIAIYQCSTADAQQALCEMLNVHEKDIKTYGLSTTKHDHCKGIFQLQHSQTVWNVFFADQRACHGQGLPPGSPFTLWVNLKSPYLHDYHCSTVVTAMMAAWSHRHNPKWMSYRAVPAHTVYRRKPSQALATVSQHKAKNIKGHGLCEMVP